MAEDHLEVYFYCIVRGLCGRGQSRIPNLALHTQLEAVSEPFAIQMNSRDLHTC